MKFRLFSLLALALIAACSGHSTSEKATPTPSATSIAFGLPTGAKMLSSHDVLTPHFVGHDLIAASPQSLDDLSSWLTSMSATPPNGYTADDPAHLSELKKRIEPYGIRAAAFVHQVNGQPHGVLVLVFDPATVRQKAGILVSLASKYRALPPMLRDPVDAQIKKQSGMTGTELLAPSNPIGAVIESLDVLKAANERGVLIIDGTKT